MSIHQRTGKNQAMVARNDKGQFCKGESGNPGGRPAAEFSITALIDDAVSKDDWVFIIDQLNKKARRGDLKAIEMLMDRRFGKPTQTNEIKGDLNLLIWDVPTP